MFLDESTITVQGGHGGRGCMSFRREKYVPKGGPDGGNGGCGGGIILIADANTDTLSAFASTKRFAAPKGRFGMGKNRNGRNGDDLILKVPAGTVVSETSNGREEHIADIARAGERVLAARGGRGGYGNAHFKTSTRQKPDFAELGEPGEEKKLKLELKLVADVGIIGLPSVGKSTLISAVSSARPKIADYPFTTLIPNLGVVQVDDRSYVLCDVPGLIEGASKGKGLGDQFLRHIERCGILLHMLDASHALNDPEKLVDDYNAIRKELTAYSPTLAAKKELVILNKIDLVGNDAGLLEKALKKNGISVFMSISAATRHGTKELALKLLPLVLKERLDRQDATQEISEEIPVLKPHLTSEKMGAYQLDKKPDGSIIITGKRIEQFTKMTDFSREGAVRRFRDVVERIGLKRVINQQNPSKVFVGEIRIDHYL